MVHCDIYNRGDNSKVRHLEFDDADGKVVSQIVDGCEILVLGNPGNQSKRIWKMSRRRSQKEK